MTWLTDGVMQVSLLEILGLLLVMLGFTVPTDASRRAGQTEGRS